MSTVLTQPKCIGTNTFDPEPLFLAFDVGTTVAAFEDSH